MEYYVITFESTHAAITIERSLKKKFKITILPTPREISHGCGIAIRFSTEDFDAIKEQLQSFPIDEKMYSIYQFTKGEYKQITW
ncbi:MAG: DUF3343 domain-containing protein [Clostridiales bacterium]|nr:DUF3343 domain-containing protein [Clostridiales bacterium]